MARIMSVSSKNYSARYPEIGFLRLCDIIGDKDNPGIIPVSRSSWYKGIEEGRYPKPVNLTENAAIRRSGAFFCHRNRSCPIVVKSMKSGASWAPWETAKYRYLQANRTPVIYLLVCGPV